MNKILGTHIQYTTEALSHNFTKSFVSPHFSYVTDNLENVADLPWKACGEITKYLFVAAPWTSFSSKMPNLGLILSSERTQNPKNKMEVGLL